MIKEYIKDVCKLLKIEKPTISYDTSHFTTATMMAQCCSDGTTIYLCNPIKITPDYTFAIAHELRHAWQIRTNKDFYFSSYKTVDLCGSYDEYNCQIAEVDANAFAAIVIVDYFGLRPQWDGLSENIIHAIEDRIPVVVHLLNN